MRWRRSRLPAQTLARADLARGEQVLGHAGRPGGDEVLATVDRLLLLGPDGLRWARAWSGVESAVWDDEAVVLRVTWLDPQVDPLELADPPARLAQVVRERVESSVVTSRRVAVRGRGSVLVLVRSTRAGLRLQIVPTPGTPLDDPDVAAAVRQARADLADQVGALPGPTGY